MAKEPITPNVVIATSMQFSFVIYYLMLLNWRQIKSTQLLDFTQALIGFTMRLPEYFEKYGVKAVWLAKKVGVSPQAISNIAKGANPSLEVAVKIEEATEGRVKCRDLLPEKKKK